jgi:heme-degrading monooxygenase HmoA
MSAEFFDCLKHKYAYVALGEFKPGRFAEAQRLYEKAVSTYKEGFKGAFLLQKPNSDEGIAVIIWEKIEDMEANQSEIYQAILEEMTPLFAKPPLTDFYEVSSEIEGFKAAAAVAQ